MSRCPFKNQWSSVDNNGEMALPEYVVPPFSANLAIPTLFYTWPLYQGPEQFSSAANASENYAMPSSSAE